ncbi:MarR family winged helix-turn-helix transcriptional regulator [Aliiroseovarius sp. PTFE2010]|uniref:MarR family winged helix-turn-helix transcriptional regulator n=1 Tax=Aliiroseovarius sp. PTFE2010 TaxID=3417190 RepID=UPI003CF0F2F2
MDSDTSYRLHDSLGYQLSMAARVQERRLDEGLRQLGLTRMSWCVLLAVGSEGLEQPSLIAEFVGIDRTATSRILRTMEGAGLIARMSESVDRRKTSVSLTARGKDVLDKGVPLAVDNNQIMSARLTGDEFTELSRLLQKVRAGEDTPLSGI